MLTRGYFARAVAGSGALTGGSSSSSDDSTSDTSFQPAIFIVGLVVIAVLALGYRWKKKIMQLRDTDTSVEGRHLEPDAYNPQLWDVYVNRTQRELEEWSWKTMQPLSVAPCQPPPQSVSSSIKTISCVCTDPQRHTISKSSLAQRRQSGGSNATQTDEVLRVSVIIAMPSQSRGPHRAQEMTTTGKADNVGTSREYPASDAMWRTDFDFMIGVGQVPYIREEGWIPSLG